jgi:hypothetical protein
MEAVPTSRVPVVNTAFGQNQPGNDAEEKRGWFPRWFKGGFFKKRPETEPAANTEPLPPARDASPLLGRRGDRTPSDQILISRCRSHLYNDPQLSTAAVHVASVDGTIYLRGTVATASIKERAELVARKTEGARNVVNEIAIRDVSAPWYQNSPVQLTAPLANDGTPITGRVLPPAMAQSLPSMPAAPAANGFVIPPAPVGGGPTANDQTPKFETTRAAEFTVPQAPWLAEMPGKQAAAPVNPPVVQLGRPEVLTSRPGLPTVTTYLIRRSDETGWPAAPAAPLPPPAAPAEEESTAIRPTARFVIPAPTAAPTTQAAYMAPELAPPNVVAMPTSTMAPARLGSASGLRSDVDAVLARDGAAQGIRYRFQNNELILSGSIGSSAFLYELTGRLSELPGVEVVSFENLEIRN